MSRFTLTVNDETHTVDVEPDTPLLWVLRDNLGLTGTKYGCGESLCGACTVHFNGRPLRSCAMPISEVGRGTVTTIEGLSAAGDHPLQKAWSAENVPQCGYCQPGQIMTAAALLASKPRPTDADIDHAMSDVLCRCGTHLRIRKAIHRAAEKGGE